MGNDLLPCPFCGSDNIDSDAAGMTGDVSGWIVCENCGASGPVTKENPENKWNTRANEWELKPLNISDYLEE